MRYNLNVKHLVPFISVYTKKIILTLGRAFNCVNAKAKRLVRINDPYLYRYSRTIEISSYLIGQNASYYEVLEGIYTLEDGTKKLMVKNKYERKL